jgi:hypothetical protein
VFISRNLNTDILLFVDDVILFANSEDDLTTVSISVSTYIITYSMKVSTDETKVMIFKGKDHIHSKICVYAKPIEQVSSFKHLGYNTPVKRMSTFRLKY